MKSIIIIACIASLFISIGGTSEAWEIKTPLGITILTYDNNVKPQYTAHWKTWATITKRKCNSNTLLPDCKEETIVKEFGPKWKNIDWGRVDQIFEVLSVKYGTRPDPKQLRVIIMPLDYSCTDESRYPYNNYEFSGYGYLCIDGVYPSLNEVVIHLGDDPGQVFHAEYLWDFPFCYTALDYELSHYFLRYKGDPCWWDEFNPACAPHYQNVWEELCM